MKRLFLLLVPCLLLANGAIAGELKSEIEAANAQFMAHFGKDAAAVAGLYTEGGQVLASGAPTIEGHEALATFWQGIFDAGITGVVLETLEVNGSGDRASEVGAYTLKTSDGAVADSGKYIVLWHRTEGGWRLHRDMFNTSNPPAN